MKNKRTVFKAMTHFYDLLIMTPFYDSIMLLKISKVIIIVVKTDLVVLELQSKVKKVAVLEDFTSWISTRAFLMEEGFKSGLPGPLGRPEPMNSRFKTTEELREIMPDYMTEWDYEPPNSRAYAKLGLFDDYQWVFQSRMKSRKEWHEKQELRKQLNEDFEA